MQKEINLELLQQDFACNRFEDCLNCAISSAYKRTFNIPQNSVDILEGVTDLRVEDNGVLKAIYDHVEFEYDLWKKLKDKSSGSKPNTVLYNIKLILREH